MNIKKKIRSSWNDPALPDTFLKKDELEFKNKKHFRISVATYILSMVSLFVVFGGVLLFGKFDVKNEDSVPPVQIEFGTLNPLQLSMKPNELNKIQINNVSYYNVRGNFAIWFNSLKIEKANVDYNTIQLDTYIKDVKPVKLGVVNDEYYMFFTKKDYLIVCYNDKYIMYNLNHADILLENFVSSF